jgi:hypothetical protein
LNALVLALAKKLPVAAIAQLFGVSEGRIWRAINVHVEVARERSSHESVTLVGGYQALIDTHGNALFAINYSIGISPPLLTGDNRLTWGGQPRFAYSLRSSSGSQLAPLFKTV